MQKSNEILKREVLQVVENQLTSRNPPETKETYDKLIKQGFSDEDARKMIGQVVLNEILDVLKERKPFDHSRFAAALKLLPDPVSVIISVR